MGISFDFKGKTAIVCGGSQGIGLEIAQQLAGFGANIVLIARSRSKLERVLQSLPTDSQQRHRYVDADFSYPQQLKESINKFLASHPKADILVNNTGGPPAGKAIDADTNEFLTAFNQHLVCNHILVKAVFPYMQGNRFGRIINILSTSVKMPIPGLGVSNTIRGAVASWSKTLSTELGEWGITVNNVLPGPTETNRLKQLIEDKSKNTGKKTEEIINGMLKEIPAGRFGKPRDVAGAVAFLASEAGAYINGISLTVDGGKTVCL